MPFGLKNAPQIYQRLLDNALYGFLRIPPTARSGSALDRFRDGIPETNGEQSVLGRRSYIDYILVTAGSWDHLCDRVRLLLEACDKWNLSISVAKSFWGLKKVDYLGHRVSSEGLEAHPKDREALVDLAFPRSLRAMQSFLGSLNYYARFMDMAVYASVLYELREVDFAELRSSCKILQPTDSVIKGPEDLSSPRDPDEKWIRASAAFKALKRKIAMTPTLRHFDPDKQPVVIVYANEWAISASLTQNHDGIYMPVMFVSRSLKPNKVNYGIVEKEVLALLRILIPCWLDDGSGS